MVCAVKKATFIALGGDLLDSPDVMLNRPKGVEDTTPNHGTSRLLEQGTGRVLEISGGHQLFPDDFVLEFHVMTRNPDGAMSDITQVTGIRVYASDADFVADMPCYSYTHQSKVPTEKANTRRDACGEAVLCCDAKTLVSKDGGPTLHHICVAPGLDIAHGDICVFDLPVSAGPSKPDRVGDPADLTMHDQTTAPGVRAPKAAPPLFLVNPVVVPKSAAQIANVCFVKGTQILTRNGPVAVENLQIGDNVWTADAGMQPILWMDQTRFNDAELEAYPHLRPVLLPGTSSGTGEDLYVSRQHLILSDGGRFHRADDLLRQPDTGARLKQGMWEVVYYHILLDKHHVLSANGVLCESFYPSATALQSLTPAARERLAQVLPWTCVPSWYDPAAVDANFGPLARPLADRDDPFTPISGYISGPAITAA